MDGSAAAGIDVRSLIAHTLSMVRSCGADVPPQENPGVQLGLALGLAGLGAFVWSMKSGQFDDLEGAAHRVLDDEDLPQSEQRPR